MTTRIPTTAADLFVLLDKEFRRRRPKACASCNVQLPYRVEGRGAGANWEVLMPPRCPSGCALVLEEVLEEFQQRYELRGPVTAGSGKG